MNTWKTTWVLLGIFSLIMAIFIIFGMRENDGTDHESHKTNESQSNVSSKLKKNLFGDFPLHIFAKVLDILLRAHFWLPLLNRYPRYQTMQH